MNSIGVPTFFRKRYRDILRSKQPLGSRNDRLKVLLSDIRLAYIGKRKPQEIKILIEEVEMNLC